MKGLLFSFALACSLASQATEYFVDCTKQDDSGDGLSEATAKHSIQAAVDLACHDDDIVTVLPGHYTDGGRIATSGDVFSRVCITNKITLRAKGGRAGRDITFIHGRHAQTLSTLDTVSAGLGSDAVRCVFVSSSGKLSHIEGFTLLDGATGCENSPNWLLDQNRGAGVYANSGAKVVDCVISNCVATYGGAIYGGEVARTFVTDNYSRNGGSAGYATKFYHSIISRSTGGVTMNASQVHNCTLVENYSSYAAASWGVFKVYNSVILHNRSTSAVAWTDLRYSAVSAGWDFYSGNDAASGSAVDSTCQVLDMTTDERFQMIAPALDDYRPLTGSALVGNGSAEAMSDIPEEFRNKDYRGETFDPAQGVNIGAYQCTATAVTGALVLKGDYAKSSDANYVVNGKERITSGLYFFGETFPKQICLGYALPSTGGYAFWGFEAEGADIIARFPQLDDTTWVLPPPAGQVLTLTARATTRVLWTDPNTHASVTNGQEATPYATIQSAVNAIANSTRAVIFAKKGEYALGGQTSAGCFNRVYIPTKFIRLVAVDGPNETVIVGATNEVDDTRCVFLAGSEGNAFKQVVTGFTLRDGRFVIGGTDGGGAARGYGGGVRITDCIITNCAAFRGAASYGCDLVRCRVIRCKATDRGMLMSAKAYSCVIEDSLPKDDIESSAYVCAESCSTWHSTILQADTSTKMNLFYAAGTKHVNTIVKSVYGIGAYATTFLGSIDWDWKWMGTEHAGLLKADPMLVGTVGDVLRVNAYSPAVGGGDTSDPDYYKYAVTDIDGNPLHLAENGKPTVGAYQMPVPVARVITSSSGQLSGNGIEPLGTNYVYVGESLTLTATDTERRNLAGFRVNGELVGGVTSYTVTPSASLEGRQDMDIAAEYVPHWYVDPNGSDSNNGWSWETPKQSLAAVMALAVSNDTVHAAPGVYTNGTMLQSRAIYNGTPALRARVVVPSFVTLESRDGPESTFIVGASAPPETANEYGCGTGAVRCVAICPHGKLKGFTVTGGRCWYEVDGNNANNDDNNRGAGIISDFFTGFASDCIISNNIAHDAGGALFGIYARCKFLENTATRWAAAARNMVALGCYFDRNRGPYPVMYWQKMIGCTIGPDNVTLAGAPAPLGSSPYAASGWNSPEVCGSLICSSGLQTSGSYAFTNCAFASELLASWSANAKTNDTCVIVPLAELATVDGVPVFGSNAAIDRGEAAWWPAEYCGTTDTAGRQRVYNGAMDIGCFEANWCGEYSRVLGQHVTVSAASPNVVKADMQHVLVKDGELVLDFGYGSKGRNTRTFTAEVTGNGVLTVTRNGEPFATLTAAAGERVFPVAFSSSPDAFVFSYVPGDADTGGALLSAFKSNIGSVLTFQ